MPYTFNNYDLHRKVDRRICTAPDCQRSAIKMVGGLEPAETDFADQPPLLRTPSER